MITNDMIDWAHHIGNELIRQHGVDYPDGNGAIPTDKVDAISEDITAVIAEILQSWLNAGSERESTMENLLPAITNEVKGWTYDGS